MEKNPEIKGVPDPSEQARKKREADERTKRALGKAAIKGSKT